MSRLTAEELKKYQALLLKLRSQLTDEVEHLRNDTLNKSSKDFSGDLSGYSLHMADQATDNYDREFLLGLAQNGREALYQIDEALKRIEDKSYGLCQSCEKIIAKARLKAQPFAENCISCQEAQEEKR
ncbi:MAG: TraR/DksA C4-type zinc finger protein [Candidatus Omnitrophica bacterium]|nr:TraR/DksA C4-type zinc finger protein [Candidatus Omnitrophota bacterium]